MLDIYKTEAEKTIEQLSTALDNALKGYAVAIETAYKYGALDAFNDKLANPPAVLWTRSAMKKQLETGE